jgi:hypothetical protein
MCQADYGWHSTQSEASGTHLYILFLLANKSGGRCSQLQAKYNSLWYTTNRVCKQHIGCLFPDFLAHVYIVGGATVSPYCSVTSHRTKVSTDALEFKRREEFVKLVNEGKEFGSEGF